MPLHPRFRPPHTPRWYSLARSQRRRKNHEPESHYAKKQSNRAPASRAALCTPCFKQIKRQRRRKNSQRPKRPSPLCSIDLHSTQSLAAIHNHAVILRIPILTVTRRISTFSPRNQIKFVQLWPHLSNARHFTSPAAKISAKNVFGSTRCAASCGHAYTQLGSFKCVHKSHEVAFCLMAAFLRPARSGSSTITSNGCKLIFPYGQFCAQSPQPMHQSSMMTSSELRLRIEPTGQPTMQSGSRHWRQLVATRYWSKRNPSRTSRVTPSCASAQAFTQASQRVHFCKSKINKLCASINPCERNLSIGTL